MLDVRDFFVFLYSPRLTWRDLQHIVVRTARKANLVADDWIKNSVGRQGLSFSSYLRENICEVM